MPFKRKTLETKFDKVLNERSDDMGIVDYLINEAKEKGMKKGEKEGREEGWKAGLLEAERSKDLTFVESLIRNTDFDDEKIADVVAVDVAFVRKVQAEMQIEAGIN